MQILSNQALTTKIIGWQSKRMKRSLSHCDEDIIPCKRRRCELITPFSDVVDLSYLYGLKEYVFTKPFSFCLEKGVAFVEDTCSFCEQDKPMSGNKNQDVIKAGNEPLDNYIAYVITTELIEKGGGSFVNIDKKEDILILNLVNVKHISPSSINLLLMKGYILDVSINIVTKDVKIFCKKQDVKKDVLLPDNILNNQLAVIKRKILSQCRDSELNLFFD